MLGNSQVRSIVEDPDIVNFYKKNLSNREELFDGGEWSEIESLIYVDKVEVNEEIQDIINSLDQNETDILELNE